MKTQSFNPALLNDAKNGSVARRTKRLEDLPFASLILGVDPGLHRTGYGLVQVQSSRRPQFIEAGFLKAKANDPMPVRLQTLFDGLCEVIKEFEPEVVVIEDLFSTYQHPRSALLMAHARGVFLLAAQQSNVPVHSFLPNEVKQVIAGNGHANKAAMQAAVKARLKLAAVPEPPDVADALAIALCFAARQETVARLK
ncbi:MAG TPA: crossover junction endodeoxyribonuclease RuvC [Abditibacteriaceae bacterium]|jgi:crossover junction endodeoxyribonuclease RuvC